MMASYTPSAGPSTVYTPAAGGMTTTSYTPAGGMTTMSYTPGGATTTTSYTTKEYATSARGSISMTTYGGSIQSALQAGKLYHPAGTVYVAPGTALKAGMYTPYDVMSVPTFEAPLVFHPVGARPMDMIPRDGDSQIGHSYKTPLPVIKDRKGCCAC